MESSVIQWIISLVSGAVGGNVAGALMKKSSLGVLGNTLAGIVGGGAGGGILSSLGMLAGAGAGDADSGGMMGSLIGNIAGSGVGGGILMAIIGIIKKAMAK